MKQILIFSGAGLSAESSISTFRDSNGLWEKYDPMVVANIQTLNTNKELVFEFYNKRRADMGSKLPNAAHLGIAQLQKDLGTDVVKIYTQNIDDLLEKAGCVDVKHVHGFISDMMCRDSKCGHVWDVGYKAVSHESTCPSCGSNDVKPGTIFFGESAPRYADLYSTFGHSDGDLIVWIGSTGEVIPARLIAGNRHGKSYTILNNLEHDRFSHIDYKMFNRTIFKPATDAWPRIREIADAFMQGKVSNRPGSSF